MSYMMRAAKAQYAGDPGLFSTLGKVAGSVFKIGKKVLPIAVPALGIGAAVARAVFKRPKGKTTLGLPTGALIDPSMGFAEPEQQPGGPVMPGTGIQVRFPSAGRFGGGGISLGSFREPQQRPPGVTPGQPMGTQLCQLPSGAVVPRRTHANKSGYFTYQQGRDTKPVTYVAPGTKCVASRRMNPLNPRALHRAMKRIVSAKRAATFLNRITVRSACPTRAPRRRSHGAGCKCVSCKR